MSHIGHGETDMSDDDLDDNDGESAEKGTLMADEIALNLLSLARDPGAWSYAESYAKRQLDGHDPTEVRIWQAVRAALKHIRDLG